MELICPCCPWLKLACLCVNVTVCVWASAVCWREWTVKAIILHSSSMLPGQLIPFGGRCRAAGIQGSLVCLRETAAFREYGILAPEGVTLIALVLESINRFPLGSETLFGCSGCNKAKTEICSFVLKLMIVGKFSVFAWTSFFSLWGNS